MQRKSRTILNLLLMLLACLMLALPSQALAFEEKPVGFVVIDHDGGVSGATYKTWRSVVKWAYHFPYYQIMDDGVAQEVVSSALRDDIKVDKDSMAALAEKSKADVLVVARIYAMDETMLSGFGFHRDFETYVRVEASADLYVYKKDGDKFLKKKLRERALREPGNYEKPEETIKWALSKLVNTMENRPIIGE